MCSSIHKTCITLIRKNDLAFKTFFSLIRISNSTFFLPRNIKYVLFCGSKMKEMSQKSVVDLSFAKWANVPRAKWTNLAHNGITGNASSLCPDLDSFILSLIRDDSIIGFIRKWTFLSQEQIEIYDIGNYRFCRNIGRHHKSNNIMIVVDIKSKTYYQKCHDPICKSERYRSQGVLLPENVSIFGVPEDFFEYECFSQFTDIETNDGKSLTEIKIKPQINSAVESDLDQKKNCTNSRVFNENFSEENYSSKLVKGIGSNICNDMPTQLHSPSESSFSGKMKNSLKIDPNLSGIDEGCNFDSSFESCQTENQCHSENYVNEATLCSSSIDDDFSCADISAEEEMIIAEVTEVVEASFSEDAIFQETVF